MTKFKSAYNSHPPRKYAFVPEGESMTQQQFKDECDVNNILAKYRKTGLLTHINKHQANFGDFSTLEDYQTSIGKVMKAQESFLSLPSELRNRFQNDPAQLIEFLSDEKNNDEAVKLGLKTRPTPPVNIQDSFEKALEKNDAKRAKSAEKKQS